MAFVELIGESPGIVAVRRTLERLLERLGPGGRLPSMLLEGETGTGKGLVARALHRAGPRAGGPFVDVNCAAIPEALLEAELFGYERGAFTDARQAKAGLFQAAHRGTLFLDEVGLLPEGLQGKLLTVLEGGMVRRLGATRGEAVDVWVVAATNAELGRAVREGRFREDVYHRLAVVEVRLPPLRERQEDIVRLAEHFLARASADYGLPGKELVAEARRALVAYDWPGNVRELANAMERVALLGEGREVTPAMLALPAARAGREPARDEALVPLETAIAAVEREHVLAALRATHWNISRAAARLGLSRNTLRYRIEKHGLRPERSPAPPRARKVTGSGAASAVPAPADSPPASRGAVSEPAAVRWERRRLTLLRAALAGGAMAGFSAGASRALELVVEKVRSFGGRVEELSPVGLVAAFGVEPLEDAANRAAHAAMAIQKAAERGEPGEPEALRVRVALHTSQFMVGRLHEAVVLDLAAKQEAWSVLEALLAGVEAGATVVSETSAPFLERRFELRPVGRPPDAPGLAYRLARREGPELPLGRRVTALVGRRREVELLESTLAAARDGRGQVVGIAGDAGIGKSRLLFEFRQRVANEPVSFLEGHCVSYGSVTPYLPVRDILWGCCEIAESDGPETMGPKVRQALRDAGMEPAPVVPYLLHLLGLKEGGDELAHLSAEAVKARTVQTLLRLMLEGSRRRPLVLAVENLHWIDTASEEFLASLVERLAGAAVLLVVTYRPGYRPPWLERSYATQVALQPLATEDSRRVVESVLQGAPLPDVLQNVILERAEGNPFFLEELARAVTARGQGNAALVVPDTVQEALMGRIDRLPDGPRRLLQTAAVLGRQVSPRFLAAVWEGPGAPDASLQELSRLELLYEQTGGDEPVYAFKHALIQEVAYESLLPGDRRACHAAMGRTLESLYAGRLDEVYDRLAHHYARAEVADRAVEYLTRCAERAARSYAHAEAVAILDRAVEHADRLPAEARDRARLGLVLREAHSLYFLGRFTTALDRLVAERERVERLGDPAVTGPYSFWLGYMLSHLGDHAAAREAAERAIAEASRCGDRQTAGKAHYVLARAGFWSGEFRRGAEHSDRAVALLEATEERWWLAAARWGVAFTCGFMGEFARAREALGRLQAIGEAIGDPRLQAYAAWTTGWIAGLTGEWEAAVEACRRSLERSPDPVNTADATSFLGYAYLGKGEPDRAIPLLEESLEHWLQFRHRPMVAWFTAFLAEAHLARGELERAAEVARRSLDVASDAGFPYGAGLARRVLGRVARARGDLDAAGGEFAEALRTFAAIGARGEVGETHLALADLTRARGDRDAAAAHLREARGLFAALGAPRRAAAAERLGAELGVSDRPC